MDFRASLVDLEKGQEIDVFEFTVEKKMSQNQREMIIYHHPFSRKALICLRNEKLQKVTNG